MEETKKLYILYNIITQLILWPQMGKLPWNKLRVGSFLLVQCTVCNKEVTFW